MPFRYTYDCKQCGPVEKKVDFALRDVQVCSECGGELARDPDRAIKEGPAQIRVPTCYQNMRSDFDPDPPELKDMSRYDKRRRDFYLNH